MSHIWTNAYLTHNLNVGDPFSSCFAPLICQNRQDKVSRFGQWLSDQKGPRFISCSEEFLCIWPRKVPVVPPDTEQHRRFSTVWPLWERHIFKYIHIYIYICPELIILLFVVKVHCCDLKNEIGRCCFKNVFLHSNWKTTTSLISFLCCHLLILCEQSFGLGLQREWHASVYTWQSNCQIDADVVHWGTVQWLEIESHSGIRCIRWIVKNSMYRRCCYKQVIFLSTTVLSLYVCVCGVCVNEWMHTW